MNEAPTALHSETTTDTPKGVLLPIRGVLTDKRGISMSLTEGLGAIGISLLVTVVAALGVGAAITFSQDAGAKGALDSVKAAQILQQSKTGKFGTIAELTKGDDKSRAALQNNTDKLVVNVSADGQNYCAVSTSPSVFAPSYWMTAKDGKISETLPTDVGSGLTCPSPAGSSATSK